MEYPLVTVQELAKGEERKLIEKYAPRSVNLGEVNYEMVVENFFSAARHHDSRRFLLSWQGTKIPRGADILGHKVAGTQNGIVTDEARIVIGNYDRLIECGGDSKKEQLMIMCLLPKFSR